MLVTGALIVLAVLVLLDLLLTFGVIRRLRDHTEQLKRAQLMPEAVIASPGTPVGNFVAATTDGESLTAESLTRETVVGFFSPGCQPCEALLPGFVDHARTVAGGRDRVVAVIATDSPDSTLVAEKVAALSPYARTIVERYDGPALTALGAQAYPAVYLVQDRTVVASGRDLRALPAYVGA
ncbi:hypothetical protein ACFFWC_13410 [Plantactinospora siamensis]|uniref:Thioredoxin domain-containing protein n=1 Tax=Plantactinospora siamensis TaxID=555372 RepID=A0ABV6P2I6_9ACTN